MKLILGGAHQGKRDYAVKHSPNAAVFQCTETTVEIDFSKEIVNSLHLTILAQLRNGIDPIVYITNNMDRITEKIVICDDISCGVVPMDKEMRQWREAVGRVLLLLADRAGEVIRVFCGIETKIK